MKLLRALTALLALTVVALAAPTAGATSNPARDLTDAGVPGAVVLSHEPGHTTTVAAGNLRAGDRFRVGSVTKTFVSTIVLQLAGEGRLSLDEPASRWVPGAPEIPLRRLLDHTSGIYNHAEDPRVFEHGLLKQWRPRELVAISAAHPPYFAPGAGFHYSNTNYVLLGLVIQQVTGRTLRAELEQRLLRPLALRDTSYDESARVPGVARGFVDDKDVTRQNTSWAGASGSLVSTAHDLARFYRALLTGRVLTPGLLAELKTRDPVAGPYGRGLFTVNTSCGDAWGHDGAVPGYLTQAYSSADGTRQVVVLVNRQPLDKRATAAVNTAIDAAYCG